MRRFLLLLLLLGSAATPLWAGSIGVAHIPLPADLSGTLAGAEYKIRVPANWNGTLLVWAHGAAMSLQIAPPTVPPASPPIEEQLLALGYALAGSADAGDRQTLRLTKLFGREVGHQRRTIVWGESGGGTTALLSIERHSAAYDAAIAVCPVAAGGATDADFMLRFDVAYAAAFGWPTDWWGPLEDVRDDLFGNEMALIMPVFQWANESNYGKWEFIRLMMKLPAEAWWEFDAIAGLPGWALAGWKGTALRSSAEARWGGPVGQNVGVVYTLTSDEKAYLSALGVNADELLAWMNANANIPANRCARMRASREAPDGRLRRPVLTMHGIFDPILPPAHEAVYRGLVEARGKGDNLAQTYVRTPGHVAFSAEQFLALLTGVEYWLDTEVRPDASFFPESFAFDNGFVPPPWPY